MKSIDETQRYQDRCEAGRILATHIRERLDSPDVIVLALPRGGVLVGFELARELESPLGVIVVRKLGAPAHPEYAMGAIASGGCEVLNQPAIDRLGISNLHVAVIADRELNELHRREALYRPSQALTALRGRTVVLVDDSLATGLTMRAAIRTVREHGARQLMVAVPVGAADACEEIEREVDWLICPLRPDPFYAVGLWYRDLRPTTDDDVRERLVAAEAMAHSREEAHRE